MLLRPVAVLALAALPVFAQVPTLPIIQSLSPNGTSVNSGAFTLTVTTNIFSSTTAPQIAFNGVPLATSGSVPTFTCTVPASAVATVANVPVTITGSGGTSAPMLFFVNKINASGSIVTSPAGSATFGTPVTFTASFLPANGLVPTGTVNFFSNTTSLSLGTGVLDSSGTAKLTTANLAPGVTNFIRAIWPGDANFDPPDGAPGVSIDIGPQVLLSADTNSVPMSAFSPVNYTVTVIAGPTGPSGSVTIFDNLKPISPGDGTCQTGGNALTVGLGQSTMTCFVNYDGFTADRGEGIHQITAVVTFLGGGTSAAQVVTVTPATPFVDTPVIVAPPGPLVFGQPTTISVTVFGIGSFGSRGLRGGNRLSKPNAIGPAGAFNDLTGSVNFFDGATLLNPAPIPLVIDIFNNGTATLPPLGFNAGNHSITATFIGSAPGNPIVYLPVSSSALTFAVALANTTTTLKPASANTVFGTGDLLTVTVTPNAPAVGIPTGTVSFQNNGVQFATATLVNGAFAYNLTTALPPGTYPNITVVYNGDTNNLTSTSAASAITITKNGTTATLATNPAGTSTFAQPVTLTATFTPAGGGAGTATGSVTFTDTTAGVTLGVATLNNAGVATLTTTAITPGVNKTLTATWPGDGNFNPPATAPTATLTVNRATPTVTLAPVPLTVPMGTGAGSTVTYTVTVTGGLTPPSGTIVINTGGVPLSPGAGTCAAGVTLIGGAGVTSTASCTVGYDGSTLDRSTGALQITATYTPTGPSAPLLNAATSAPQTVTVTGATPIIPAPTAVPVTGTLPLVSGQPAVISVVITGLLPATTFNALSGSVNFFDGGTLLNAAPIALSVTNNLGAASLPARSFSAGLHNITVQFIGSAAGKPAYLAGTGPALALVVGKANTTTTLAPPSGSMVFGSGITLTATVAVVPNATGTPTGVVSFVNNGLPFATAPLNGGVATYNLTTALQPGSYLITAVYGGDVNDNVSVSGNSAIQIFPVPVFTIPFPPSLAAGTVGVPYAASFGSTGGNGAITWSLFGGSLPDGISFFAGGSISGTPNTPGTFGFTVRATDSTGATADRAFSLVINPATLTVTGSGSSDTTIGSAYSFSFGAAGGVPPYTFGVNGSLPAGTSLSGRTISGNLTTLGTFTFTISVGDSVGGSASKTVSVTVTPAKLSVVGGALPDGQVGTSYTGTVAAKGGVPPYKFTGSAPSGLSVGSDGGVSGTPTVDGQFSVSVTVTDSVGATASGSYSLTILPQLIITTTSLPGGTVNVAYSAAVVATGGAKPYVFTIAGTPDGVSGNSDGSIGGTPTTAGTFTVSATVKDANGRTAAKSFGVTIAPVPLSLTLTAGNGTVGAAYSGGASASGGVKPYTFAASGLPAGVSIASGTGALSGTPTTAGTTTLSVTVTDASGKTASQSASVTIGLPATPPVTITGVNGNGTPGGQQNAQLTIGNPYPLDLTVILTLTFAPGSGLDDPNVTFANGTRKATLVIPAGNTVTLSNIGVQTGTVAGVITITAQLSAGGADVTPSPAPTTTIRIAALAPTISSATAVRNSAGFTVTIVGFVTDREVTSANFTFNPAPGSTLQTTSLTVTVDPLFVAWFASSAASGFGGQFTLTQPFLVQGSSQAILSVTITLVNKVGSSNTITVNLQ